jgi:regulator of sigma E protease
MTTAWAFILVLSGLIFVHELGHFLVARMLGISVLKFSIGFGPRVWGFVRGETDYCISAIPLGGFVKMLGENPEELVPKDKEKESFSHRPPGQRAAVVGAGPAFNFLFAWLIVFFIILIMGNPVILPDIGSVQRNSPAEKAGVMAGDRIVGINGIPVDSWRDVSDLIKEGAGREVNIEIERDGGTVTLNIVPEFREFKTIFGETVQRPVIGITASGNIEIQPANPVDAAIIASNRIWEMTSMIFQGIVKLFENVVPLSSLGGPIMIAQMAGEQAEQGMVSLFYFMALLSVNLGLLNLLPIPVLDGGHLLFCALEAVSGKRLTLEQMKLVQQAGMVVLGSLMLLVFYNDIMRLFGLAPGITTP